MKRILIIVSLFFLLSCGTSSESTSDTDIDISGRWIECRELSPLENAFTEVTFSNGNNAYESFLFGSTDNQCINIIPGAVFKTNATVVLENPHLTGSGLMVYDYTLLNVTDWAHFTDTTTPQSNFYSILYLDGDKLYFGKLTLELDGTSEEKRPDQIEFSVFLTKQ